MTSQNGDVVYDIKEYVCDGPEDIANLPRNCGMGSTCVVISTSEVYMMNSKGEWVKI
jgi:hypothetical protein